MFNSPMLKRQTQHYIHPDIKQLHELDNGGTKMKKLLLIVLILGLFTSYGCAQMSTGQGGGMMGGGWGWGMNSGWFFMIIIAILVILGIVYMMKRR